MTDPFSCLYQGVWSHANGLGGRGPSIFFPETLVFEGGTCIASDWYFTHRCSDGSNSPPSGVYRKRISTNEEILRQLLAIKSDSNRESDGIVANMVWFSDKLCVRYLTAPDLQRVLMDDGAFPYPESTWILQSFVTPDYDTSMNTIVSTPIDGKDPTTGPYFSPSVLVNKHKFHSGNVMTMSLDPDQILVVDRFSSKLLMQAIEYQSQLADVCIRSLHPAIQLQFSYYFRFIESTGQLHLLWCQAVPSSSSIKTPQSPSSLSQTIPEKVNWTNGKLMQEVLASYDSQANKQATSKSVGGSSSSGGGKGRGQSQQHSKRGGKSRKEVIAALYLKQAKPHRKAKEGVKQLPPWNEINSVKYAIPDEDAERYDQIKKAYSVRNVALFDVPQPPQMPAPSHQFARPVTSQSGNLRGPGTAPAAAPRPSTSASTPGPGRSVMTDELSVGDLSAQTPARTLLPATQTPTLSPKLRPRPQLQSQPQLQQSIPTEASLAPTASNALRHAEQFGRKGRQVRKARKEEADIGALIAPPGSSEDLIDYTTAIIMKVCDKLGQCLSEAQEFADEHREAVVDLLQRRDSSAAAASSAAGSGLRRSRPELSLHEDEELLSLSTQSPVETILRHIGLERDDDSVGESSGGDDGFLLTWSQKRFLKVLELLICVPNHRPADQLSTILLWILSASTGASGTERPESDSRMHDDLIRLKNMMGGFSKYSYGVRSILAEVSQNQSLRSAGKDPSVQTTIDATINLRAWIVDKYQVIRSSAPQQRTAVLGDGENEDDGGDYGEETGMAGSRASTPGGDAPSPTTSVLLQRHAQVQAAESNPAVDLVNAPKKPLFSGPVQRLGRGYNSQGVPGTAPVEVTRRVRAHVGMDAFLAATRLPRPSLLDAPKKNTSVRQSLRSSVAPPLVASYSEYPEERDLLDDGVVETGGENGAATGDDSDGLGFSQFNTTGVVSRRKDDPRTSGILRELSFFQLAPKLSAGQRSLLLNSIIADAAQTIILNVSVLCRHACAGREIAHDDLVALFGTHIITIVGSQLVNRLLAWLQSNRRSNSVFKRCNPALIELGMLVVLESCIRVRPLVFLHSVTHSRPSLSLKALQRQYAFWPRLNIQLLSSATESVSRRGKFKETATGPSTPNTSGPSRPTSRGGPGERSAIVTSLVWNDRYQIGRTFADPQLYLPNANII